MTRTVSETAKPSTSAASGFDEARTYSSLEAALETAVGDEELVDFAAKAFRLFTGGGETAPEEHGVEHRAVARARARAHGI